MSETHRITADPSQCGGRPCGKLTIWSRVSPDALDAQLPPALAGWLAAAEHARMAQ